LSAPDLLKNNFKSYVRLVGSLLFLIMLARFLFLIPFGAQHSLRGIDDFTFFRFILTGFRFDFLVFGFIAIPLWILFWSLWGFKIERYFLKIQTYYLAGVWVLFSILYFNDFFYYARHLKHFYGSKPYEPLLKNISYLYAQQSWGVLVLIHFFFLFFLFSGVFQIFQFEKKINFSGFNEKKGFKILNYFILSFLGIGLAARGNLSPHHLEKADSEISKTPAFNELVLSSPWAILN